MTLYASKVSEVDWGQDPKPRPPLMYPARPAPAAAPQVVVVPPQRPDCVSATPTRFEIMVLMLTVVVVAVLVLVAHLNAKMSAMQATLNHLLMLQFRR